MTSILSDPNVDPHEYESDPQDAAVLGAAKLVVLNGLGYDDFANKLLSASASNGRTVLTMAAEVGATESKANPHLWYNPEYVTTGARAIEAALATAQPRNTDVFKENLQGFLAAYQPYIDTIASIKAKYSGAEVAYTERVPGYLVTAAGLKLGGPTSFAQAVEDGQEPSPGDTDAMTQALSDKEIRVLLYNNQVTDDVTDRVNGLAQKAGVPVVGVSETIPKGAANFQIWQIGQARALLAALGG